MNSSNFLEKSLSGKSLLIRSHGIHIRSLYLSAQTHHLYLLSGFFVEVAINSLDLQIDSIRVMGEMEAMEKYLHHLKIEDLF